MEPQTTKQPPDPLVLGIVTAEMLRVEEYPEALWACGGIELRADGLASGEVVPALEAFTAEKKRRGFEGPVVFTLRLERDGGAWPDAEAPAREAVWKALPSGACDWADLEIEEAPGIDSATVEKIREGGIKILLSHHAFAPESPARWTGFLEAMDAHLPDGVKFAVMTPDRASAEALLLLARAVASEYGVSCVMGMGAEGAYTRLVSPLLGCPLTYGFIGDRAVAPGQLSAKGMQAFFRDAGPGPGSLASEGEWLDWARARWDEMDGMARA